LKQGIIIGLILVAGLILVSAVYAHFPGNGYHSGWFYNADIESVEKFQKDTLPL